LSVNQDDGRLMLTGADIQSADGARSVGGGMVTESRMMTGRQILDKAQGLEKRGHTKTAEGLRKLVSSNVKSSDGRYHGTAEQGRGLLADETASITEKQSYDGKSAETYVRHGSDVSWFDTSSDRQGRTVRKGDEVTVGDHASYGDSTTLTGGTFIRGAAQMAMDGNPLLVSEISRSGLSRAERDTERLQVAGSVAADLSTLISRKGSSRDISSTEGSVGGKIPFTEIGVSTSKGYQTADEYDVHLGARRYNEVLKQAEQGASGRGVTRENIDRYVAQQLQTAVKEDVAYFEKHGQWSYGAFGVENRLKEQFKPGKKGPDPTKSGIDGIKG
jgi:hypothetical protein